jgi:hypothetical protein
MTAAGVRVPHARWIVAGAALLVCAVLLWLTRTYTFYFDEWTFIISAPGWTLKSYFEPHNEHPSILLKLAYAALLDTAGLRSYLPYMAALLALHLTDVVLLFELVRRRAGDLLGLGAAMLLLVIGNGWEDLLWAFQMAWLASIALGLGMLILLQGSGSNRRVVAAAALLAGSFAFSGIGVVFAIAATAFLVLTPGRRRQLVWLAPVAVAVLAWYALAGYTGNHPNPPPTLANVFLLPAYVAWALMASAAGVIGVGGWAALAAAVALLGWSWLRHGTDSFAISVAMALVGFYVTTGMTRAQLGYWQGGSARYVYLGALLWIILLADVARAVPWRGTWRPVVVACIFLACFNSATLLAAYTVAKAIVMQRQVADYYALAAMRNDPCLDPAGAVDPLVMPVETDPAAYYRAVDRYGDPRDGMPLLDHASYEAGVQHLRRADC